MPGDVDLDDVPYEDVVSDDVELEMKKERESRKRQELLAKVDFSRYTYSQTAGWSAHLFSLTAMKIESHSRQKYCQCSECTKTRVFI